MKLEQRERMLQLEQSTCVHFNGTVNIVCKAGVMYSDVAKGEVRGDGDAQFLPCIACENKHGVESQRRVKQDAAGLRGVNGTILCPRCGQTLHYTVEGYTGHTRAQCTTDGCLSFIE